MRLRFALALALCAPPLAAQTVRGIVSTPGQLPLPGVVVTLIDGQNAVIARALTNERGEYRVVAPSAGTYRVRTLRIGYRPVVTEPIALVAGQDVVRALTVSGITFTLDTVRVADAASCRLASDSAHATFGVWEQARAALTATQLTAGANNRAIRATLVTFDRVLDGDFRRVKDQRASVTSGFVTQPWRALAPDSLHRAGYVWEEPNGIVTYNAPGLDALISSVFVEDHCFRLVSSRDPKLVGIAFTPTKARAKTSEIEGTLWLDRATSALRSLEYAYANVAKERAEHAGGEMAFARMANGGWIIAHWAIRMPSVAAFTLPNGKREVRAAEVHMTGGEIALVVGARSSSSNDAGPIDTLYARPPLAIAGTVVDSATSAAVPNARVALLGTAMRVSTDTAGRFAIGGVLPGSYELEVRTPALDSVGTVYRQTIDVIDSAATATVRLPAARAILGTLCRGNVLTDREAILLGIVYARGDSAPRANVSVVAEWNEFATGATRLTQIPRAREGRTDAGGRFVLCGVARNTALTVRASSDADGAAKSELRLAPEERVGRVSLTLDPHEAIVGTLSGVVLADSTKTPIAGAEVSIPELGRSVRTDSSGAFRLADVPVGERQLSVRRVGYGPLDSRVTFRANRTIERTIYLAKVQALESVLVRDRLRDPGSYRASFEERKRLGIGKFYDSTAMRQNDFHQLGDMLRTTAGLIVATPPMCPNARSSTPCGFTASKQVAISSRAGDYCALKVYVNGVPFAPGGVLGRSHDRWSDALDLRTLTVQSIESMEIYRSQAELPAQFSSRDAPCGVLAIWLVGSR